MIFVNFYQLDGNFASLTIKLINKMFGIILQITFNYLIITILFAIENNVFY
ncbi:hypothetical protein SAMN05216365_10874 [Porphyromonadaceae bacterium NLAE-zl-C104]|nr:hypothetical protein SAMN05216331_11574 [Porphyromonadaceae bacterium KH3R12]SFS48688.1 hypothetical protein SAMN05216365_10874 [Porphyromonadaceae bacterium NLAE-zl-C104]